MTMDNKKRIGRYELLDEIGRGGMAVVYRAWDSSLNREVALKLLHPHLASHKEARIRFQREAHAFARLHHKHIVEVYDYSGEEGEDIYIIMELIEGTTLRKFLADRPLGPLSAEAAALIACQIFDALASAHEQGVVHRDVKPENILIGTDGNIRLSDFGIAHLAGLDQMTVTGQILGSPAYMSPEHIELAELDARADIFSAGTLLYEMAVGSLPFHGSNPHQIIKRIIEGYYDQPLGVNPSVGHHVAAVIVRCMQRDPERRYESAGMATTDLNAALEKMGITSPQEELVRFFEDPDGWENGKRETVVLRTLVLGQAARKGNRLPEAMDHFNRVLALEPGNEKALDAVAGLSRRRRLNRGLERASIGLAVVVAASAIIWAIISNTGTQGSEISSLNDGSAKNTLAKNHFSSANAGVEKSAHAIGLEDAGAKGAASKDSPRLLQMLKYPLPKAKRNVVFTPHPMSVEIEIDGADRFSFGLADRSRMLTVGKHTVKFIPVDKRRMPATREIMVNKGDDPMPVRVRLKWRPARMRIKSNVNAVVGVEGHSPGKTNTFFDIPLENDPQERVKIVVSAKGYRTQTKQVTIAAGETEELTLNLPEERSASPP